MKTLKPDEKRIMTSAKVGPKGQIVIPKEVRDMFGIDPGDTLIIFADTDRGIAIQQQNILSKIADKIFDGNAKEVYPEQSEDASINFAQAIKKLGEEED